MDAVRKELAQRAPQVRRSADLPAASIGQAIDERLLRGLMRLTGHPPIELILGNGVRVGGGPQTDVTARVRIRDRATLLDVLRDPAVRFGDAYAEGRIDIEGDLVAFIEAVYRAVAAGTASGVLVPAVTRWARRRRRNTLDGSRENIHHHYDIGNDFYALWLGSTMAYTCAYYPTASATLDEAQVAKFEHVCRKLRLRAGESVVEAGCGWGGLAMHMARRHGVRVRAFNISREQVAYARASAAAQGLGGQLEFVEDDYRNITGRYDAFVSVGMLEHVGVENYGELGRVIRRALPRHGRGLIHSIGRNRPAPLHPWIEKRIFPGAEPPSPGEMAGIFEPVNLSVVDLENLRLHYARTLTDWKALFERSADRVREMFDERFVRMWRLYLAGSIAAFTTGSLQLFQVLFAPHDNNDLPLTRADLYRD